MLTLLRRIDGFNVVQKCLSCAESTLITSSVKIFFFFFNCVQLIIDVVSKKIELLA